MLNDKVVLQTTTTKIFDSVLEYQSFVSDLAQSGQFESRVIESLRQMSDYAVNEEESGYHTVKIKSQTRFRFIKGEL